MKIDKKRLNRDKTEQRSNKISNLTVETRKAAIHAAVLRVKKKGKCDASIPAGRNFSSI